jgi:hypothetical protein
MTRACVRPTAPQARLSRGNVGADCASAEHIFQGAAEFVARQGPSVKGRLCLWRFYAPAPLVASSG